MFEAKSGSVCLEGKGLTPKNSGADGWCFCFFEVFCGFLFYGLKVGKDGRWGSALRPAKKKLWGSKRKNFLVP